MSRMCCMLGVIADRVKVAKARCELSLTVSLTWSLPKICAAFSFFSVLALCISHLVVCPLPNQSVISRREGCFFSLFLSQVPHLVTVKVLTVCWLN